jgi:hypothetical protein
MSAREIKAVVIMHYDENGWLEVKIADPDGSVVVLTVDDRVPHDRVYEHLLRVEPAEVLALAPRPWGNKDDERQKQTEIKIHRLEHGLRVVDNQT